MRAHVCLRLFRRFYALLFSSAWVHCGFPAHTHTHTHTHVRVCVDGGALCVFTGECNLNCIKIDWIHGAQLPGPLFPPLTTCQQTGHPVNGSRDCPLPRHHSFSSLLLRPSSGWCLFCAPLSGQLALKIVYTQTSQHFTLRTHDPNLRGLMTCLTLAYKSVCVVNAYILY